MEYEDRRLVNLS